MTISEPAGEREFSAYVEAMEGEDAPLLGHMVLYSIFEGQVTPDQVALWFAELGLDPSFLPGQIRPVDVYEKITGPAGVRRKYSIGEPQTRYRARRDGARGQVVTLMIRHVSRDSNVIVRHVVREVRDEAETRLSYTAKVAEVVFCRDPAAKAQPGAGSVKVTPEQDVIGQLPAREQDQVNDMLDDIRGAFENGRLFLTADRLRATVRSYVESLYAIRVRTTGGVYFVGRQHARTLASLRELVKRFGTGSSLTRIPLPDRDEMREMVISAFIARSEDELTKLARNIDEARANEASDATIQALHRRYQDLVKAAQEHEELLGTAADDTKAAMNLVQAQLTSLLLAHAS